MKTQDNAWSEFYPELFERLSKLGIPEGFAQGRSEVGIRLDKGEIQEGKDALVEYLERLKGLESPLTTEIYFLVLQIAEEASIMYGLGFLKESNSVSKIENAIAELLSSRREWLSEDMDSERFQDFRSLWPFTVIFTNSVQRYH